MTNPAVIGGLLIGLTVFNYKVFFGKVLGISNILHNRTDGYFLIGLLASGFLNPHQQITFSYPFLFAAGLLVGYGTRLANGCTSGHGIAGLSRFSPRSLAAVVTFISFAMLTRFMIGFNVESSSLPEPSYLGLVAVLLMLPVGFLLKWTRVNTALVSSVSSFSFGILFGSGLVLSGMSDYRKVLSFFPLDSWDPSMIIVMICASLPNMVLNLVADKFLKLPLFAKQMNITNRCDITNSLVLGSAIFGIGWGMVGLCPGPAVVNVFQALRGDFHILYWILGFYVSKLAP